jgi:general nucleoside transport system permease protein
VTVLDEPAAMPAAGSPSGAGALLARWRATWWWRYALFGALYVVLVTLARATGGRSLTAQGTFNTMLILGSPVLLAGLGGLFSERAGIVNIGLEGMMIMGTWGAALFGWKFGAWWGVLGGVLGGLVGALLMILTTVVVGVDHVVAGVAINILAPGLARYLSSKYFNGKGGSIASSPQTKGHTGVFRCPFLTGGKLAGWKSPDLLGWLARKNWYLLSDVAGSLRGLLNPVPWTVVIAIALVPLSAFVLWRTRFGLRLRSAGENPFAADSLGVPVHRMQVFALLTSGALAGFAGAVIVLETASQYREGQTGGRGFIGLAALIFGNYRPSGVAAGAALFGYADGIAARDLSGKATRGLLLLLVGVLVVAAIGMYRKRRWKALVTSLVLGALVLMWFVSIKRVPESLVSLVAPVVTLVVLTVGGNRLRPPKMDGLVWRKGMQS